MSSNQKPRTEPRGVLTRGNDKRRRFIYRENRTVPRAGEIKVDNLIFTYEDEAEREQYPFLYERKQNEALYDLLGKLSSSIRHKLPLLFDFPVRYVRLDLTPEPHITPNLHRLTVLLLPDPDNPDFTREAAIVTLHLLTSKGDVELQRSRGGVYCWLHAQGSETGDHGTCDPGKVLRSLQKLNGHPLKGYLEVKKDQLHRMRYEVTLELAFRDW
jgi:hypothetical protein